MKKFFALVALGFSAMCSGQTVSATGSIEVQITGVAGDSYTLTIPASAVQTVYTPAASITSVQASCSPSTVNTSGSVQCSSTVTGQGNYSNSVAWSVSAGTITSAGMFTAPSAAGTVTLTATSMQDQSKAASTNVVVQTPAPTAPVIPDSAIAADLINPTTAWKACVHDAGTPGTATCSNNYPVSGIFADSARAFSMTYTSGGGVRWADSFAKDTTSTNFVLDAVVLSPDWTHVANLELDTNQVKADSKTAILGTQCGSYSKTWEVTLINPSTGSWHWVPTNVSCNPLTWTPNTPHHVRIFGTISASDVSTYIGVELDGVYAPFTNATGPTGLALGWGAGSVLTNVQIDGLSSSGSATVYSDRLTIYRW